MCGGRKRMAQTVCEMARHPQVIEVAGSVRVLRVCRVCDFSLPYVHILYSTCTVQ